MNFATVPTVQEALTERIKHPLFGYFPPSEEYFDSIIRWQTKRNGVIGLSKEHIGYENGVLGGVISALGAFAVPGTVCCFTVRPMLVLHAASLTAVSISYTVR